MPCYALFFVVNLFCFFFFFFSSRRRHTRCSRDWSSDVCSSDLKLLGREEVATRLRVSLALLNAWLRGRASMPDRKLASLARSEERRVGKECRSRWSPYDEKKEEEERRGRRELCSNASETDRERA